MGLTWSLSKVTDSFGVYGSERFHMDKAPFSLDERHRLGSGTHLKPGDRHVVSNKRHNNNRPGGTTSPHHIPALDRHRYLNGYGVPPSASESSLDTQTTGPTGVTGRSLSRLRVPGPPKARPGDGAAYFYSQSTLGAESGFSSTASFAMASSAGADGYYSGDGNTTGYRSNPSSPQAGLMRRKPPPKPPRMKLRQATSTYRQGSADTLPASFLSPSPGPPHTPTPSLRSEDDVFTLKSSIVDVTNTLDTTLTRSRSECTPPASPMVRRYNPPVEHEAKVCGILAQTRDILTFELDPDPILTYLSARGVLERRAEDHIRRLRSQQARCGLLIDVITSKGQAEFVTFCDALRHVGSQSYLSDFLHVLDALVRVATSRKLQPSAPRSDQPNKLSFAGGAPCVVCSCNNNNKGDSPGTSEPLSADSGSFDIEIWYVHRDTGVKRTVHDIANMKRRRRPLSITSEDFALLEEADRYVPMIEVSLYNQCLMDGSLRTIANVLADYPCVRELSLVKNHLDTTDSVAVLMKALDRNQTLVHLDVRLNRIGNDGAQPLARTLSRHQSLRVLNVTSTNLGGLGCSQLIHGLATNQSLADLNLGFNEMSEASCEELGRCLAVNKTLCKLRMRCNNVTPYGARCVFKGLRRNARVSYVDISRNSIKDESVATLAEVLLVNRALRGINLENCGVTAPGCRALARALKTNGSLRSLDLSMNAIGDEGAEALAEGLKYNKSLLTLCLNMCNIGNRGLLHLLAALRFNTTLTTLKLCYNRIGKTASPDSSRQLDVWRNLRRMPEVCLSGAEYVRRHAHRLPQASSPMPATLSPSSPGADSMGSLCGVPQSPCPSPAFPHSPPASPLPFDAVTPGSPTHSSSFTLKQQSFNGHYYENTNSLRDQDVLGSADTDPMEVVYEVLCEVLQQNKHLKVLLWGNNFEEASLGEASSLPGPR